MTRAGGILALVCAPLCAAALAGCAAAGPAEHIVMFAEDGRPVDPSRPGWFADYAKLDHDGPDGAWGAYLDRLFTALERRLPATDDDVAQPVERVVLYIHGGLNTVTGSVDRAAELAPLMLDDGVYPVFVNWRSNLLNSYFAHVGNVRQGAPLFDASNDPIDDAWDSVQFLFFPLVLAADVARGVIRFPFVAVHQLREAAEWSFLGRTAFGRTPAREKADAAAGLFVDEALADPDALQVEVHTERNALSAGQWAEVVGGGLRWFLFLPAKVVSTLVVDIGGTGSWSMMNRRVNLLFEHEERAVHLERPERGLRVFLARLAEAQQEHGFEVDLVGHSMGALVVNRILRESVTRGDVEPPASGAPDAPARVRVPEFRHVTYLAAACSVADYETSAFPYLLHHPDTRVHHVTLHPDNEVGEAPAWDLAPRGSLLTWIDDFLALPLSPRDRTAGRAVNLLAALENTPAELRPRVTLRVLPWDDDRLPQTHGGFDDLSCEWRFWRREDWRPIPAESEIRASAP